MKTIIVIPARYASTRFPGKPLAKIAGQTMVSRVYDIAVTAAEEQSGVDVVVATDHQDIVAHCKEIGAKAVMTSDNCISGSDRVSEAVDKMGGDFDFIINLQGDVPLLPPEVIRSMIESYANDSTADVVTPVVHLSWEELDNLRLSKRKTPFSGTTAILNRDGTARWFSKNIIPAVRKEDKLREEMERSPVHRHIGLYGYSAEMLKIYATLPEGHYEKFEGLEQLRVLENGYTIRAVKVKIEGHRSVSGVDTPEDAKRSEEIINQHGEILEKRYVSQDNKVFKIAS